MPEYFVILCLLLMLTVFLHYLSQVKLFKSLKHLISFYAIALLIGSLWDQTAIARGHWTFGERFLLGPRIGFMPIEEYLFIIITGYFGMVIYRLTERWSGLN